MKRSLSNSVKSTLKSSVKEHPYEGSLIWSMSAEKITDVSAGSANYIDDNLNLQTIASGSPLLIGGALVQMGSWKEFCTDPENPLNWVLKSATKADTLVRVGSFKKIAITDTGATFKPSDQVKGCKLDFCTGVSFKAYLNGVSSDSSVTVEYINVL